MQVVCFGTMVMLKKVDQARADPNDLFVTDSISSTRWNHTFGDIEQAELHAFEGQLCNLAVANIQQVQAEHPGFIQQIQQSTL